MARRTTGRRRKIRKLVAGRVQPIAAVAGRSSGNFSFGLLPEGTCTVTRGTISETRLTNGLTAAGTAGGTVTPTVIFSIALGPATTRTGDLFPKVPQARIAIATVEGHE